MTGLVSISNVEGSALCIPGLFCEMQSVRDVVTSLQGYGDKIIKI